MCSVGFSWFAVMDPNAISVAGYTACAYYRNFTVTSCKNIIGYTEGWRYVCILHILGLCSISGPNVWVQLVLRLSAVVVSESCECVCYIRQHGPVYLVVAVVPIEIHLQVPFALPIMGNFLVLSENWHQVLRVVFANVFQTKIINAEWEVHQAPFVCPKYRSNITLVIAFLV